MDKNIYDLLNEIKVDLTEYNEQELSELEKKKLINNIKEKTKLTANKRNFPRRYMVLAATIMIAGSVIFTVPSMASSNPTIYKIASFLGINKDLKPYETIVKEAITKDGITMSVDKVIIDNDKLIVSTITTCSKSITHRFVGPAGDIYINGEVINNGSTWTNSLINDFTGQSVIVFPIQKKLTGNLDVKLVLKTPLSEMKSSPHWIYEFSANGEGLRKETSLIKINKSVKIKDDILMNITDFSSNPVGNRIMFDVSGSFGDKLVTIEGVDEKGNPIRFVYEMISNGKGDFLGKEYNGIIDSASKLTLSVCVDGKPIGEAFTIEK